MHIQMARLFLPYSKVRFLKNIIQFGIPPPLEKKLRIGVWERLAAAI
jgi:hypothetical protein